MKISTLTIGLTIASACTTGVAHAVSLNPHGLGQVLLYPYYTVNKGQDTLLSVINSSDVGKVVKVRFLEGYNGRQVFDFNVFLSAHDVWTAVVSQVDGDSGAKLATSDHTCTFPSLPAEGKPFWASTYTGTSTLPFDVPDSGPQTLARTREGHIEIVADGDVIPGSETDINMTPVQDGTPGGGRPPGCSHVSPNRASSDVVAPTSGLSGSASIVNVGEGTFFAYTADALADFTDSELLLAGASVDNYDTLTVANSAELLFGARAKLQTASGDALAVDYERGIDAVSAVLMADSINNDYLVSAGLGANTDWIVTFPTKRFYVDPALLGTATVRAPFVETFTGGHSSVSLGLDIYDQEGFHQSNRIPSEGCGLLCPPLVPFVLPYEVNAIRFVPYTGTFAPSGVFGSQLSTALGPLFGNPPYGDAGWARIGFNDAVEPHALAGGMNAITPVTLNGLPSIGFMVYNIVNINAAPGRLANYGATFAHRSTVSCTPCENSPSGGVAAESSARHHAALAR